MAYAIYGMVRLWQLYSHAFIPNSIYICRYCSFIAALIIKELIVAILICMLISHDLLINVIDTVSAKILC